MLPKTSAHGKRYDEETKWMYFFLEDGNNICNRVGNSIKKELDCKRIYNKKLYF